MGRAVVVLGLVAVAAVIPLFGPSVSLAGTQDAPAPGAGVVGVLRTVLFAALCVPAGELFAHRLIRRLPQPPGGVSQTPPGLPRSWAMCAAVVGCVAAVGLAGVVAAGNLIPHHLSDLDTGGLYHTRDGRLALLEVNAFLTTALCTRSRHPTLQALPLSAIIVAEALRAHPATEDTHLLGSTLTLVHLTCGVLWTGTLLYILRTLHTWRPTQARQAGAALLGLYSRIAAVLLAALTATGTLSALRRMPPPTLLDQLTTTGYGRTLLAKLLLITAACTLALTARHRLKHTTDPLSAYTPARSEIAILTLVVAASALLTALPLPITW